MPLPQSSSKIRITWCFFGVAKTLLLCGNCGPSFLSMDLLRLLNFGQHAATEAGGWSSSRKPGTPCNCQTRQKISSHMVRPKRSRKKSWMDFGLFLRTPFLHIVGCDGQLTTHVLGPNRMRVRFPRKFTIHCESSLRNMMSWCGGQPMTTSYKATRISLHS